VGFLKGKGALYRVLLLSILFILLSGFASATCSGTVNCALITTATYGGGAQTICGTACSATCTWNPMTSTCSNKAGATCSSLADANGPYVGCTCTQCNSGVCCDTSIGKYRSSSYQCGTTNTYRCTSQQITVTPTYQYCTGSSTSCSGSTSTGTTTTISSCNSNYDNAYCTEGSSSSSYMSCSLCSPSCVQTSTQYTCGTSGTCTSPYTCNSGYADCTAAAGCETQLGRTALIAHGSLTSCSLLVCDDNNDWIGDYADCNSNKLDGCETLLSTNTNCGGCGDRCSSGYDCTYGVCKINCALRSCSTTDPDGCCPSGCSGRGSGLANEDRDCLCPASACNSGQICSSGTCVNTCADSDGGQVWNTRGTTRINNVGSTYTDYCAMNVLTEYYCSSQTGPVSSVLSHTCDDGDSCTTNSCSNGACVYATVPHSSCGTCVSGNLHWKDLCGNVGPDDCQICANGCVDGQSACRICTCLGTSCNALNNGQKCDTCNWQNVGGAESTLATCRDGVDNDCDGITDCGDSNCNNVYSPVVGATCGAGTGACYRSGTYVCNGAKTGTQCNAVAASPGVENTYALCHDGVDNDCDGLTDCADANCIISETCNALDDDCNGVVNNGLPNINPGTACSTGLPGVCSAGTRYQYCNSAVTSYTWSGCTQTTASSAENTAAKCTDGLDNDCDGSTDCSDSNCLNVIAESCSSVDEDCDGTNNDNLPNINVGSSCSTGLPGVCSAGTRYQYCNSGVSSYTWSGCTQTTSSSAENTAAKCTDGLDNDCDGSTDCADSNCLNVIAETCDSTDNDCDGSNNDNLPNINTGTACSTGLPGVCSSGTRYQYCNAGVSSYTWSGCTQTTSSSAESCNSLDDDCDGTVNDNLPNINVGSSCTTGLPGVCSAGTRYQYCNSGVSAYTWSGCTQSTSSSAENTLAKCTDGLDNDCDGITDCADSDCASAYSPAKGSACNVGTGACARSGTYVCNGGNNGVVCSVSAGAPGSENTLALCRDGVDNDCDGTTDCADSNCNNVYSYVKGAICTSGSGACAVSGVYICNAGNNDVTCSAVAGTSVPENTVARCHDGINNDCDASTDCADSDCLNVAVESCNSVDDDCDGSLNEGLANINTGSACSTGLNGVCSAGTRYQYCDASVSSYTWSGCTQTTSSSAENTVAKCHDGLDNDCDGSTDCADPNCLNVASETCDSTDNDCDGSNNEGLANINTGTACATGSSGVCSAGTQYQYCNSGVSSYTWSTCSQTINASTEICDNLNNDCDSFTDENCDDDVDMYADSTITCSGSFRDGNNVLRTCASYGGDCNDGNNAVNPGVAETCNGMNDDCDAYIDEYAGATSSYSLTTTAGCNQNGVCLGSAKTCTITGYGPCSITAGIEVCNPFIDDDCDAAVNENLNRVVACALPNGNGHRNQNCSTAGVWGDISGCILDNCSVGFVPDYANNICVAVTCSGASPSRACTVGIGACQRTGLEYMNCVSGSWSGWSGVCSVTAGTGSAELCNAIDDNCNGLLDYNAYENIHSTGTEICNDGFDNDCDNLIDAADLLDCISCGSFSLARNYFEIRNSSNAVLARVNQDGVFWIKGTSQAWAAPAAGYNHFIIQNSGNNTVMWIDSRNGNLYMQGSMNSNTGSSPSGSGNFVIQDSSGNPVFWVTSAGSVYSKGCFGFSKVFV
jgi:hypothetical protein